MCHGMKDLGENWHWAPFCGCPALSQLGGEMEGVLGLVVPYPHSGISPFFLMGCLSLWVNSESQMITTLPFGYFRRHWFFLKATQQLRCITASTMCFWEEIFTSTCHKSTSTCHKRNCIFSIVHPPSLQQVKPQLFVAPWSSTVVGVTLRSNYHF